MGWKDSNTKLDRVAFAIAPGHQLKIGEAILFNAQRVHRGPCNKTGDWRIVVFMHWPVGIYAAIERKVELGNMKAGETSSDPAIDHESR